jgi:hypothetical protein
VPCGRSSCQRHRRRTASNSVQQLSHSPGTIATTGRQLGTSRLRSQKGPKVLRASGPQVVCERCRLVRPMSTVGDVFVQYELQILLTVAFPYSYVLPARDIHSHSAEYSSLDAVFPCCREVRAPPVHRVWTSSDSTQKACLLLYTLFYESCVHAP